MADAVQSFRFSVPAGNGAATLHSVNCNLGICTVTQVDLVFPAGCAGLVAVQVTFAQNPVYPIGSNSFFILDNDRIQIPVSSQGNSGAWGLTAYNKDFNVHTVDSYFYYNYVQYSSSSSGNLVSI